MKTLLLLLASSLSISSLFSADPPEPKFEAVTIDERIQIGYGVAVADVHGDKLPDILLAFPVVTTSRKGEMGRYRFRFIREQLSVLHGQVHTD